MLEVIFCVAMLSFMMLSVVMLTVVMLTVVMLSIVMLSVVGPFFATPRLFIITFLLDWLFVPKSDTAAFYEALIFIWVNHIYIFT
jgi:hypothetical protein